MAKMMAAVFALMMAPTVPAQEIKVPANIKPGEAFVAEVRGVPDGARVIWQLPDGCRKFEYGPNAIVIDPPANLTEPMQLGAEIIQPLSATIAVGQASAADGTVRATSRRTAPNYDARVAQVYLEAVNALEAGDSTEKVNEQIATRLSALGGLTGWQQHYNDSFDAMRQAAAAAGTLPDWPPLYREIYQGIEDKKK